MVEKATEWAIIFHDHYMYIKHLMHMCHVPFFYLACSGGLFKAAVEQLVLHWCYEYAVSYIIICN